MRKKRNWHEKSQFARQIWKNMLIYVEECKITRKKNANSWEESGQIHFKMAYL